MIKMLLAKEYDPEKINPEGYYISEKLDGTRALYDPIKKKFISRNGKIFNPPDFFIKNAPDIILDGELWHSRESFEKTGTVRKTEPNEDEWKELKYMIFDVPNINKPYEDRLLLMNNLELPKYFKVIPVFKCKGHGHLMQVLDDYVKHGSEGLMLRKPGSFYEGKRSNTLLKVKTFSDDEAVIQDYTKGKNRLEDMIGAFVVKNSKGIVFKIGTGLNDEMRQNPPKIGTVITYKYCGFTKNNVPRFATFYRVRPEE